MSLRLSLLALVAFSPLTVAPVRAAERTVAVSATGIVQTPPDELHIGLALKTVDDDLVRVRAQSDRQVQAVMELAQKHGAKEGDYEIGSLSLGLSFNEQLKRQIYHVDRKMTVKLGVLGNLNPLLADLLKQPDVKVKEIEFSASKGADHERTARGRAMAAAKQEAEELASLAGLKLGKAVRIDSTNEQRPFVTSIVPVVGDRDPFDIPAKGVKGSGKGTGIFMIAQLAEAKKADAGAFGLGLIEYSSSVNVEFELKE